MMMGISVDHIENKKEVIQNFIEEKGNSSLRNNFPGLEVQGSIVETVHPTEEISQYSFNSMDNRIMIPVYQLAYQQGLTEYSKIRVFLEQ